MNETMNAATVHTAPGLCIEDLDTMTPIDKDVSALVDKYGIAEIVAALARECNKRGMPVLFRRLDRLYNWMKP